MTDRQWAERLCAAIFDIPDPVPPSILDRAEEVIIAMRDEDHAERQREERGHELI